MNEGEEEKVASNAALPVLYELLSLTEKTPLRKPGAAAVCVPGGERADP